MVWQAVDALAFIASIFLITRLVQLRRQRRLPLPPGPPGTYDVFHNSESPILQSAHEQFTGLPIVGNLFGLPKKHEWIAYADWSKEYGVFICRLRIAVYSAMLRLGHCALQRHGRSCCGTQLG